MLHVLCITVCAHVVCRVCVFVSSGEWAQIGNPVYGVIDFPVPATGSVWLLIPRDSDVTPDGASCLLIHDKVWGAFPLHTDQIMLCFCPRPFYHSSLITLSTFLFFFWSAADALLNLTVHYVWCNHWWSQSYQKSSRLNGPYLLLQSLCTIALFFTTLDMNFMWWYNPCSCFRIIIAAKSTKFVHFGIVFMGTLYWEKQWRLKKQGNKLSYGVSLSMHCYKYAAQ